MSESFTGGMFEIPPLPGGTMIFRMSSWFQSGLRLRLLRVFTGLALPHCSRRYASMPALPK